MTSSLIACEIYHYPLYRLLSILSCIAMSAVHCKYTMYTFCQNNRLLSILIKEQLRKSHFTFQFQDCPQFVVLGVLFQKVNDPKHCCKKLMSLFQADPFELLHYWYRLKKSCKWFVRLSNVEIGKNWLNASNFFLNSLKSITFWKKVKIGHSFQFPFLPF